jgi:uncharacterized damage-inducible protein DinB
MAENFLVKLFEHNNWANQKMIQLCSTLSDEQLDSEPQSVTKGTIRRTLEHLVGSQQNYLSLLTLPVDARSTVRPTTFAEFLKSAQTSGEGLLALARDEPNKPLPARLQTTDGYSVEPWVAMVQVINHSTEHREQISSMLSALGVTPPDLDGWSYGEAVHALVPIEP